MNDVGVKYQEFKLGIDYTREELKALLPENLPLTAPQVFIYNKRIGGYEDLAEYLESTGVMGLQT
jgi:glutaredoxin